MKKKTYTGFATRAIHVGQEPDPTTGAYGLAAAFGMTPIFCAKAMKRGSSL